jgi:hypothetical protein
MKKHLLCWLSVSIACLACQNVEKQKLVGKWQATSILEDGMPMPIPASVVGFEFFPNGYYNFRSTLEYKEVGTFDVSGNFLHTLDTINEASTPKTVQIMLVNEDSLLLKMNADGKEQLIKLFKIK